MAQENHPEWREENSLTAPSDRDITKKWRPNQGCGVLTESEVESAMNSLNNTSFTDKFPRVDRTYADPPPPMQNIGLISFTPAKGATPNEHGVYGFAKLRGNYATPIEANQRAEWLIRNVDSYHQIYHTYVGRPFPITFSSKYSAETDEIDIRKETTESVSSHIKSKKSEEQREVDEVRKREEQLLEESRRSEEDPYELYVTLRVKKAQLTWTYLEHQKKIKEVKEALLKTRKEVTDMDEKHPTFIDSYFEKYMKARREAGLEDSAHDGEANFIKYMIEEVELEGIDDQLDQSSQQSGKLEEID